MSMEVMDMDKHDKMSMFFRPREESARAARAKEPRRQPTKNED